MCLGPAAVPNFDNLILSKIKEERARLPGSMGVIGMRIAFGHFWTNAYSRSFW